MWDSREYVTPSCPTSNSPGAFWLTETRNYPVLGFSHEVNTRDISRAGIMPFRDFRRLSGSRLAMKAKNGQATSCLGLLKRSSVVSVL